MHRLRLLGGLDLDPPDGAPAGILTQPRRLALLAHLALQPEGDWLRRDRILPLFWPELDESAARAALSQSLHVLRRTLGPGIVQARGTEELRLDPAALDTDVRTFEAACAGGDWPAALAVYRGELLPGFHLDDAPEFERWLDGRRATLHRAALAAAARAADAALAAGHLDAAVAAWRRALDLDPHDEASLRGLLRALQRRGSRAEALREADAFAARLHADLDLEPSAETRALLAEVRRASAPAPDATATVPAQAPVARIEPETVAVPAAPADAPPPLDPTRRRARRLRLVAMGSLAIGALALVAVRALGTHPTPASVEVAVLPFAVRGAPALGYLREGMVDLLATKLEALGTVRAVPSEAVLARVAEERGDEPGPLTPEEGARIARGFGSDLFVLGRAVQVGNAVELSATLFDVAGRDAGVATRRAEREADLPAAVDDLVRDLVAARLAAPAQRLERLAVVSSSSHVALRHYLEGERRYRAGDYGGALTAFRDAVGADSLFALAWYRLSVAAGWVASEEHYLPAAHRAAELADRLTEHDRTLVLAHDAYARSRYDEAERGFRSIVSRWPDDAEAWYDLGEVLFHANPRRGRPIGEARDAFERVNALVGIAREPYAHRISLRLLDGGGPDVPAMLDTLRTLLPPGSPHEFIWGILGAVATGDEAGLRRGLAAAPARPANDVIVAAWAVASYTDRLGAADTLLRGLLGRAAPPEARAGARALLVQLLLARGRWDEGARELERLAADDAPRAARLAAGFAAMAPFAGPVTGDSSYALRVLDRLARPAPPVAADSGGLALGLRRWRIADSLAARGDGERARGWYESFPIIFQDDLPLVVPAQLRLAAIHDAAGRADAARRAYRRALALWAEADPRLAPALGPARARLAALDAR